MPAICCAGGCTNRHRNDISLHNFSRDEKIRAKWVFALRHTGTPYSRDSSWTPRSRRNSQLVCSAHFEKSCFTQQTRTMMSLGISCRPQLDDSAVPTIFASSFGGTGQTDKRRDAYRKRNVQRNCEWVPYWVPLDLEAYHSVVNHFAPKLHSYTCHGQLCRQHLAALHFNENSKRKSAVNKDGNVAIQIAFPKYKTGDEFSIKIKREKMTSEYVESLLREVLDIADRDSGPSVLSTPAPPFLSSGKRRPCQDEISRTLSRYTKFRFGERRCLEY